MEKVNIFCKSQILDKKDEYNLQLDLDKVVDYVKNCLKTFIKLKLQTLQEINISYKKSTMLITFERSARGREFNFNNVLFNQKNVRGGIALVYEFLNKQN